MTSIINIVVNVADGKGSNQGVKAHEKKSGIKFRFPGMYIGEAFA